ncbi:hypothetical protein PR202_ga08900 [Eleusine coracana subsp. coracana]|uniref:Uncharacterized protein n=1 Tax=Eleusine coracana subsp. coracana TaxID=191504 RepID=A0AAV5C2F7_ELECO|nr:hypothetical protein QOZ80_1AG0041430 [Eleusine coracana subsp. coracana]GJM92426.1 hypothetical protein PR202_ga08900 [Eleusine coracana subsp. coracana]
MESGELLPRPGPPSVSTKPAGERGGWRAAHFLLVVVFLERVGFVGVEGNLIMYLTGPLGMSTAAAAASTNAWTGTVLVLPLVGALAADSRLGRYAAVLTAGVLYLLGLGILTVSSTQTEAASAPSSAGLAFFYIALYLIALAQGFHRPCAQALGADQFAPSHSDSDPSSHASRSSFFNWYHFAIAWGYAVSLLALSYVEDNIGWTVGFGASWVIMVLCLAVFLIGARTYRAEQRVDGTPFVEAVRAWAASIFRRRNATTDTERLLVPKPEEGKGLVAKLVPIWLLSLVFAAAMSQLHTLFTKQGSTLDRRIGETTGLVLPPAALQCIVSLTFIVMVPVYDGWLVPLARRLTVHGAGVTTLQRIGAGTAMAGLAMATAALVEARRLRVARDAGLVDQPDAAVPMSLWWVVPQYVLVGLGGVLGKIGLEEFFYDEVPDALRSVGVALSLSVMGAGSYVSGVLVSAIDWVTRRSGESWFHDNLNRAHLDYFYWILAALVAMELAVFAHFAKRFVYRSKSAGCDS